MGASLGGVSNAVGSAAPQSSDWLNQQYQTNFGRNADQGGSDYWNGQLNSGAMTQDQISQALASSAEGQQYKASQPNLAGMGANGDNFTPTSQGATSAPSGILNMGAGAMTPAYTSTPQQAQVTPTQAAGSNTNMDWLNQQYQQDFGRAGDQAGLNYWNQQMQNGMSQADVQKALQSSSEYTGSHPTASPDTNWVSQAFQNTMGRAPDAAGLAYWQQQAANGMSQADMQKAFQNSAEYKTAHTPIANKSTAANTNPFGITTSNPYASSTNPYIQAAQQNALGNLAGAQTATAANRVNQSTPYQNLQYTQTGVDAQGNPIWSANQSLAPGFQGAMNNIQRNVQNATANPFDVSKTQNQMSNAQNPNFSQMGATPNLQTSVDGTGMSGWDKANQLIMSRLKPQMEQRDAALDAKLANQGLQPGTEAYNRAKLSQSQANNDLMTQAQLAGSQVQNQMFNQNLNAGQFTNQALTGQNTMGLANMGFNNATGQQNFANSMANTQMNNQANQNNYTQNLGAYNNPLQQLNAFTQGTNPNYVNSYNQAAVSGPDYLGSYTAAQNAAIAAQNAANAKTANTQAGLFGLGSSALLGSGGLSGLAGLANTGINGVSSAYNWLNQQGFGNSGLVSGMTNGGVTGNTYDNLGNLISSGNAAPAAASATDWLANGWG